MKKLQNLFLLAFSLILFNVAFTACDKDDDGEYYAGESEEDYKPNYYTIESTWDLSAVSGLTASEKKELENELSKACNATEKFDTRAQAVASFDSAIAELRKDTSVAKGVKAVITLKRGTAIIKRATLQW